jgi:hypothetical protein
MTSTNWSAGIAKSTDWTGGTIKTTNWGSEDQHDFSSGYLLLQNGDDILLQNGYKIAKQ